MSGAVTCKAELKFLHPDAKRPYRGRDTDAGFDLYSIESLILTPGIGKTIRTGICISVEPGFFYTVKGRSGMLFIDLITAVGTVDAAYTGEILVRIYNAGPTPYTINKGDRVAQLIFQEVCNAEFTDVTEFSSAYSLRGTAGFGSSGK